MKRWGRRTWRVGIAAAMVVLALPGASATEVPILFGTNTGTDQGVGVVNADGSGRRIALAPPTNHEYLIHTDLSPDGRRIVFSACDEWAYRNEDQQCHLATVNVDGSDVRHFEHGDLSGRWSPDGQRIAAVEIPTPPEFPYATYLTVLSADGSSFRNIVKTTGSDVDWSPDGKTLVPLGHARFCGSMWRKPLRSPTVGVALVP